MVIAVGVLWPNRASFTRFFHFSFLKTTSRKVPNGLEKVFAKIVKEDSKKFVLEYPGVSNYKGQVENSLMVQLDIADAMAHFRRL